LEALIAASDEKSTALDNFPNLRTKLFAVGSKPWSTKVHAGLLKVFGRMVLTEAVGQPGQEAEADDLSEFGTAVSD
jgi:hypothetical protein